MLLLDKAYFTIKWNSTVDDSIVGQTWTYQGIEASDLDQRKGFDSTAMFKSVLIANTVLYLYSNKDSNHTQVLPEDIQTTSSTFTCFSKLCPNWVHFDKITHTLYTFASETNYDKVNGTYIYFIETIKGTSTTRKTLTLIMH